MNEEKQTDFFDLVEPSEDTIEVKVSMMGDHWWATIANWWCGTGATREEAIKSVARSYQNEMNHR
jgi:hypothetical protein